MLGNFLLLTFCEINFFKKFFQEHYQSENGLGPDQDRHSVTVSVLIWVQTVCKIATSKERVKKMQLITKLHLTQNNEITV